MKTEQEIKEYNDPEYQPITFRKSKTGDYIARITFKARIVD